MSKNQHPSIKGRKLDYSDLKMATFRELRKSPHRNFSAPQLLKALKISNTKAEMSTMLIQLKKEGKIKEEGDGIYRVLKLSSNKVYTGVVDMTRSGAGYIKVEDKEKDIYVPGNFLNGAQDGDVVKVEVIPGRGRRNPDGRVLSVLRRARSTFMGKYFGNERRGYVLPFKAREGFEITIFEEDKYEATEGDIVLVDVIQWPDAKQRFTRGRVIEVLGQQNSSDLQMKSILIHQGFNLHFSEAALAESESISPEISQTEISRRRDMRTVTTFTIDPINAKDFDDALSYHKLENGNLEIGVHIADVTHYLQPDGALDKEAYERSTSVYLVDRVLPMLPETLSNDLCSLRPNEDKLTFSVVFELDSNDKIVNTWFGKTVINSDRRFTYEEAQQVIVTGEGDYVDEVRNLNQIAQKLSKERYKHGAISFESDEVVFRLDEDGYPVQIYVKERMEAHMLIEDFMLLANRSVAEYIHKKGASGEIPFIYRVHDLPNEDKLADFAKFAAELGFKMDISNPTAIARSLNVLAKKAEDDETLKVLTPLAIRTMAKAEYTTKNIGHYGLGFEDYSHFTSPIRRYSDVIAHRLLFKNLGDEVFRANKDELEAKCKHISAQERKAMDAERESIKYKQVEYMTKFIGKDFEGIVAGFHDKGIFIELVENLCEGMVRFDRFGEGYTLEEGKLRAIGDRSGRIIKMGDKLMVRILDTDLEKRQIELDII